MLYPCRVLTRASSRLPISIISPGKNMLVRAGAPVFVAVSPCVFSWGLVVFPLPLGGCVVFVEAMPCALAHNQEESRPREARPADSSIYIHIYIYIYIYI